MIRRSQTMSMGLLLVLSAGSLAGAGDTPSPAAGLERAAFAAASDLVTLPDRFEPASFRFGGEAPPPGAEFDLLNIDGPNQSGIVRMTFAVLAGQPGESDQLPREVFASVRGTVHGPALVATRAVARGDVIDAGAVELAEMDLTRLRHAPVRDPGRIRGRVPVRTLGAGRVITENLLQPMPVVRRNQAVTLEFVRRGFSISATGTALADGAPGETITAVNTGTGTRVLCEVQPDGSLHVIRGLGDGRRR